MNDVDRYEMISREQSLNTGDHVTHNCCAVLYAPVTGKLFGKYDMSYTVMVCCILHVCILCVCVHMQCVYVYVYCSLYPTDIRNFDKF